MTKKDYLHCTGNKLHQYFIHTLTYLIPYSLLLDGNDRNICPCIFQLNQSQERKQKRASNQSEKSPLKNIVHSAQWCPALLLTRKQAENY